MKIAVINNFFPPRPGGSSHLSQSLAAEYEKAGHEVIVLTAMYGDAPNFEQPSKNLRIHRLSSWTLPKTKIAANFDIGFTIGFKTYKSINSILSEFQPDLIHQHGQFFDLTWQTGIWARIRKIPTVLSIHTRLESPLSKINTFIYAVADQILVRPFMWLHKPKLVVMDRLMDEYINRRYAGAFSGKLFIPVGIDPMFNLDTGIQPENNIDFAGYKVILSVGHVIPQRSRIALAKAMPKILESIPNAKVLVVGGVYNREFLDIAERLGVEDAFVTTGAVPKSEMPQYYSIADMEVHELEGGGFGTASLEALSTGIPVAAAVREDNFIGLTLRDKETLYLVPFISSTNHNADPDKLANVIIEILSDPSMAKELVGKNAQVFIEKHFTLNAVAREHLNSFKNLINEAQS